MTDAEFEKYMKERVDDQFAYFDNAAVKSKRAYQRLKMTSVVSNVLTIMAIAIAFTVSDPYRMGMGILALVLSTVVLATYQIEEFQCFGPKWANARLVAERLKSEKFMVLGQVGKYSSGGQEERRALFAETVERLIRSADTHFLALTAAPGKRSEKWLRDTQDAD